MAFLSIILILTAIAAFAYALYSWATQNNNYFKLSGLPALPPTLFFGNTGAFFFKKVELIEFITNLYNAFPDDK